MLSGTYRVRLPGHKQGKYFSHFDGEVWHVVSTNMEFAQKASAPSSVMNNGAEWSGFSNDPRSEDD